MNRISAHICALDKECRLYSAGIWRLEIDTPWWHLGIAFTRMSQYGSVTGRDRWTSWDRK